RPHQLAAFEREEPALRELKLVERRARAESRDGAERQLLMTSRARIRQKCETTAQAETGDTTHFELEPRFYGELERRGNARGDERRARAAVNSERARRSDRISDSDGKKISGECKSKRRANTNFEVFAKS